MEVRGGVSRGDQHWHVMANAVPRPGNETQVQKAAGSVVIPDTVRIIKQPSFADLGTRVEEKNRIRIGRPEEDASVDEYVAYFDRNRLREGLPHNWADLQKKVGFSMRSQMDLLEDTRPESVAAWVKKTEQDIKGFSLEYLSKHLVYPCRYERDPDDATRLIDPKYGKKDIAEIVSADERNGAVKESLGHMKEYFLQGGQLAVMPSPMGESGLRTDDGNKIDYPDSYWFIMQREGNAVVNYTVKTDFSHQECRDVIYQLTGKLLPPTAPIEEYVRAIAYISPNQHETIKSPVDVIRVLEGVRAKKGSTFAFENTPWSDVYADIQKAEQLYAYNEKAQRMLEDFKQYSTTGTRTKEELKKGLAATILRISKLLLYDEVDGETIMKQSSWYELKQKKDVSYGQVLTKVASIPGCAGGGQTTVVTSLISRLGVVGDEHGAYTFTCPDCKRTNTRNHGELRKTCEFSDCRSTKISCEN